MSLLSQKEVLAFVHMVCSLFCLISLSALVPRADSQHAETEQSDPKQKLLLLLLDGARHDYLDQKDTPLPGFKLVTSLGVQAEYLIPDFPTLSYPNYYSIMTGLHTESHGMTGNYMYDVTKKEKFLIGTNPEQFHAHWWDGGDPLWTTAVRQNKRAYMYYWPGCEVVIHQLRPTFCQPYVNGSVPDIQQFRQVVVTGLQKLQNGEADIVGVYLELLDSEGHAYGPLSQQVMAIMRDLDPVMAYLAQTLNTSLLRNVNLLAFSDHGHTRISPSRVISLIDVIEPGDYEAIMGDVAVVSIYPTRNAETKLYEKLKNIHPNLKVYRKEEIPDRWHYKRGRYVAAIIVVADPGWLILHPEYRRFPTRSDGQPREGWHGYDNNNKDMMSLFFAMGPSFGQNVKTGPIMAVDLYQIMCRILSIQPSPNNGSWERVLEAKLLRAGAPPCVTSSHWVVFPLALAFVIFTQ